MGLKFREALKNRGVVDSRIGDLNCAIDNLHNALCKLDIEQRRVIEKRTLNDWLALYAKVEGYINIVPEIWWDTQKEKGGE